MLTLLVLKISKKGRRRSKSDIIPMHHYQVEGSTIRTISTTVPESGLTTTNSRMPTENRAPSIRDSNESYDNPLMIPNSRNRLPPL